MEPLVSVIIPAYNVHDYLGECIESVLNQTYPHWEMIVVNDGSLDDTLAYAQRYASQDQRIRVIDQENSGVSVARNAGLYSANGKYVIFLDGDDYWKPSLLRKLVTVSEQSEVKIVYCGYNRIYRNGFIRRYRYKYPNGDILIPPKDEPVQLHIGAMLFERNFLTEHRIAFTPGCPIGEDVEVMEKALALTPVRSVPENLMLYRQRGGSALHSGWDWQKQIHALKGRQRAIDFIIENASQISKSEEKITFLQKELAYKILRFLWRMLRNGDGDEVMHLLGEEEFSKYLKYLDINVLGLIDHFKFQLIRRRINGCG